MISVAIGGVVVLICAAVLSKLYQMKARSEFLLALTQLRLSFQNAVIKPQSWTETQTGNSEMSCFSGSAASSCLSLNGVAPQGVRLYSGGSILYDSRSSSSGFTRTGQPCSTFGTGSDCVLKPALNWHVECNLVSDPTCLSPLVMIDLSYTYSGPDIGPVNYSLYGFKISKATFPMQGVKPCGGVVPVCTASQAAICESGSWVCREFGL